MSVAVSEVLCHHMTWPLTSVASSVRPYEEGHHPDLHLTNYRDVELVISTHAIGGLSLFDFILAAKMDQVEVTYSPKWVRENSVAE